MSNQSLGNAIDDPSPGDLALLGFFLERPLHGYEVHRRLMDAQGMGLVWRVKQAQLYARLAHLEETGYLRGVLEPQEARPPRRVFHLTESGRQAFDHWLASPVSQPRAIRLAFMQKLFFAVQQGEAAVGQLVSAQRALCEEWLARQAERDGESAFVNSVRAYRRGQLAATVAWLDSLLQLEVTQ